MTGPFKSHPSFSTDGIIGGIVGNSLAMQEIGRFVISAADSNAPVLLMGETGTGKNLIASTIHQYSLQKNGVFLRIPCGSLNDQSFDQILSNLGLEAIAEDPQGGTLFFDEIDQLTAKVQGKLLDIIQGGRIERWQEHLSTRFNMRIIAATNQDLEQQVKDGKFREDLYWKLSVLPIFLPPLRRREGDVELLVEHFLKLYSEQQESGNIVSVAADAMKALVNYAWPGNIHELQNYLQRGLAWGGGKKLTLESLPAVVTHSNKGTSTVVFRPTDELSLVREFVYNRLSKFDESGNDLYQQVIHPVEKELLSQVMEMCQHTQTKAASWLGINRNTLYKKLVEFELIKNSKRDEG